MPTFKPEVNPAAELLEIASDFGDAREIIREALSNSIDANATNIKVRAFVDHSHGNDELVIVIDDNGEGMDENELKYFFGLGFTTRALKDELGRKIGKAIGEKGHGTKIYFNSSKVDVITKKGDTTLHAFLDEPKRNLRRGLIPDVVYERTGDRGYGGTTITVRGYNDNNYGVFSHESIRDYIYWFTKFGSCEKIVNPETQIDIVIILKGVGTEAEETLGFGHLFPPVNTDIRTLRGTDPVSPLDYFVARWVFPREPVIDFPDTFIDIVFYLEGDKAKKTYNAMIHDRWQRWHPGQYNVQDRYGLWLCKDYIPIERRNTWVAEASEWTKYHAFINCQSFKLTANRRDLGNTPPTLIDAVEKTVRNIFATRISNSQEFIKFREELLRVQGEQTAEKEEREFQRRKRLTLEKRVLTIDGHELLEPRQEAGVLSILLQLTALNPDLFGFKIVDYDSSFGYDLLVTEDTALDLNRASLKFVELKLELKRDFDHTFQKLAAIVCWDTKLRNGEEVYDCTHEKRNLAITAPPAAGGIRYTKYVLCSTTEPHNIEIIVLKHFLAEYFGRDFRPRVNP